MGQAGTKSLRLGAAWCRGSVQCVTELNTRFCADIMLEPICIRIHTLLKVSSRSRIMVILIVVTDVYKCGNNITVSIAGP